MTALGPRVWETWKEAFEIYLPDGSPPAPWNSPEPIPQGCREAGSSKMLSRSAKVSDVVDLVAQAVAADGTLPATLKDQQGRLLRYEIRLNRPLFEFITHPERRLYNGIAQADAKAVDFPNGSQLIKAAWRQIDAKEAPYFHTTQACVCEETGVDTPERCRTLTMGLAGFHIMTKTPSAPQWIWSTFEQINNVVPTHGGVPPLNDPSCPESLCPPNRQSALTLPNQVRRVIPIPDQDPNCSKPGEAIDNVAQLNADVQKALNLIGSPFENYQLIGTQWPLPEKPRKPRKANGTTTVFDVLPQLLGNTTMETFAQNTSSCMGCHAMSRTLSPSRFVSADFSFTLNNAQPRPLGALCQEVGASESCSDFILSPPLKPKTPWDLRHWPEVLAGYGYAQQTYELTNPRYVRSRLHCSSCHLNAGGNRNSAWWVNMWDVYNYPATTGLQDRINGCFERSMNGQEICSTKNGPGACAKNPVMSSLIVYMKWLTDQFFERHPDRIPCRGYPPFTPQPGDAKQGRSVYVQKCSFCHNAQGQGRYESDTYFRPALWGPDSYNACAGLASTDNFSTFVRWNMPYTSGGLLSDQEANDLAAYVDGQCRPGKGGVGPDGEPCPLTPGCINGVQGPSATVPAKILARHQPPERTCPEFLEMGRRSSGQ